MTLSSQGEQETRLIILTDLGYNSEELKALKIPLSSSFSP
jgi:hypothetical protein